MTDKLYYSLKGYYYLFTSEYVNLKDTIYLNFLDIYGNKVWMYSYSANYLQFLLDNIQPSTSAYTPSIKSYSVSSYMDYKGENHLLCGLCDLKITCLSNNKSQLKSTVPSRFKCASPSHSFYDKSKADLWLKKSLDIVKSLGFTKRKSVSFNRNFSGNNFLFWQGWDWTPKQKVSKFNHACLNCVLYKCKSSCLSSPQKNVLTSDEFNTLVWDKDAFVDFYLKERTNEFLMGNGVLLKFKDRLLVDERKYEPALPITKKYPAAVALAIFSILNDNISLEHGKLFLSKIQYLPQYQCIRSKLTYSKPHNYTEVNKGFIKIKLNLNNTWRTYYV